MVFSFTLKGFIHKFGVLHFCIYFLVRLLFKYLFVYTSGGTIHIRALFIYMVLFTYMVTIHQKSTNTTRE